MTNSKVVFICAPYDAKDRADHVQEMERVAHFRNVVEGLYHYKTFAPGSYITGPEKEARDFRVEVEDIILKNCNAVFVCGSVVTAGMQVQIAKARVLNIPIYRMTEGDKGVLITLYEEKEKQNEMSICKTHF